ncbi:MAG: Do family serine endopeptidase [Dysgonamonadaceae bacterium]|nr:Do family serine endopeptidase [Dysgonamonadaceae bacterium]MDD4728585.1 Do family serine endopeptidase [Dysgonamonadaceae bacterium]
MKTKLKHVLTVILVAILSATIALFGYDYMQKKNVSTKHSNSVKSEFSQNFSQDFEQDNVRLTNLTTSQGYPDFTEAAKKTIHGVVHVKTTKAPSKRRQQPIDPFEYFFGFGNRDFGPPQPQVGFGSGVIISKDGYILTNNHVVAGASEVSVTLNDNREFTATVIGADPKTDIALIKIEGNDFDYVSFGNSDDLEVGEWVLAVGNPFNLTSTVTAGIVSAKNRSNIVGQGQGLQSFIQIDAAVNPGNSGGALVNTRGELVGINTAIYSQTGNFAGYAFAIPISIAGKIASDIKEYGTVQRAVLGILSPNIDYLKENDSDKYRELQKIVGVQIDDFSERSSAKAAGIEKGDIIKSINSVPIKNFNDLQNQIGRYRPGDKVKVVVDRKGKESTYTVELQNDQGNTDITKAANGMNILGATFGEITDSKKQQLGISSGVEVTDVTNDGKFRKEGINKGFIILRINNMPVNSEEEIAKIVQITSSSNAVDKAILIAGFYPNGKTQYIAIDLSAE